MALPFNRIFCLALMCSAAGAFGLSSEPVHAQASDASEEELAKARRLYREGLSLEAAGDWAGALAKFEAVARVRLTPQVRFHMARCKEELGRLNEALGDYRVAEYDAREAGAREYDEISAARQKLEGRVPTLVITRGDGVEGARIELDGVELGEAKLGKEISVDPGPHRIVVRLPDGRRFEERVEVGEGESTPVELILPDDLLPAEEEGDEAGGDNTPAQPSKPAVEEPSSTLPWVIGGAGVASLVASGVFYMMKNGVENDMNDACRGSLCPKSMEDQQSNGESYALMSNITFGLGLVGVGVAAVWLLTGNSSPDPIQEASGLKLDVGTSSAFSGVQLSGQF